MHADEDEEIGAFYEEALVAPADRPTEKEMISTRTLALTRFQRNHEYMDEVFLQAALGSPIPLIFPTQTHTPSTGDKHPPKRKSPWSIFEVSELESKSVRTKLPPRVYPLTRGV